MKHLYKKTWYLFITLCLHATDYNFTPEHKVWTLENPPLEQNQKYLARESNHPPFKEEVRIHFNKLNVETWTLTTTQKVVDNVSHTHQEMSYSKQPKQIPTPQPSQVPARTYQPEPHDNKVSFSISAAPAERSYIPRIKGWTYEDEQRRILAIAYLEAGYVIDMQEAIWHGVRCIAITYYIPGKFEGVYFYRCDLPGFKELEKMMHAVHAKIAAKALEKLKAEKEKRALAIYDMLQAILPTVLPQARASIIEDVLHHDDTRANYQATIIRRLTDEYITSGCFNKQGIIEHFAKEPLVRQYTLRAATLDQQKNINFLIACTKSKNKILEQEAEQALVNYARIHKNSSAPLQQLYEKQLADHTQAIVSGTPCLPPAVTDEQTLRIAQEEWDTQLKNFEEDNWYDELTPTQQAEQIRLKARKKALQETNKKPFATQQKQYTLSSQAASFLQAQGNSLFSYTSLQGTLMQHQLHSELIDQIEQTAQLYQNKYYAQKIPNVHAVLMHLIESSLALNKCKDYSSSASINDLSYSWLTYAKAVLDGIALGCKDVYTMFAHPQEALLQTCEYIGHILSNLEGALCATDPFLPDDFGYLSNTKLHEQRFTQAITTLHSIESGLEHILTHLDDPTIIKELSRFGSSFYLTPVTAFKALQLSTTATIPLIQKCLDITQKYRQTVPSWIIRTVEGTQEAVVPASTSHFLQDAAQSVKKAAAYMHKEAKRRYNKWPKIQPIILYEDLTYLKGVLKEMSYIEQVQALRDKTKNFTSFAELSEIQIKYLQLYGWFYENGYQHIMQKMNRIEYAISYQNEMIPLNPRWPWFHSLIGDVPKDWNRKSQPSGGHFDFFNYGESMYHFHEGFEKSAYLIKGNRSFIEKTHNKKIAHFTKVVENPVELAHIITNTFFNASEKRMFQHKVNPNQIGFICKNKQNRTFAYLLELQNNNNAAAFQMKTFYEIFNNEITLGEKWTNL